MTPMDDIIQSTDAILATVEAIKASGKKVYIISTGAGAGLQNLLWGVPGISSVLVGAAFPYATNETNDVLGFKPKNYCTVETAVDLAMAAYLKAWTPGSSAVGIGLSASVASDRAHRGEHRIHVAIFSEDRCRVTTAILAKGVGLKQRTLDGNISDLLGLKALAYAATNTHHMTADLQDLMRLGLITEYRDEAGTEWARERFFLHPYFRANGTREETPKHGGGLTLFPGAFNPPHEGHFGIAFEARKFEHLDVTFSICVDPPHKPELSVAEMLQRAKLLKGHDCLFTSGDPLYVDKAKRFEGANLIIGADALVRMMDPQWGVTPDQLATLFAKAGTTLWVVGRVIDGKYQSVNDLAVEGLIPEGLRLRSLNGRWDVSSSQLREKG